MTQLSDNPQQAETLTTTFNAEVQAGERFPFGENWREFLNVLNEDRIVQAELSLKAMLDVTTLQDKTFLDIGSGSGLFSLAARRLGARVHSFDYDPASVWCTNEVRRRYFPDDPAWKVEQGSALDKAYLQALGQFDVVYAWGVLQFTGAMWQALDNAGSAVKPHGGKLFIAVYNDQGWMSKAWRVVKKSYCHAPASLKPLIAYPVGVAMWTPRTVLDIARLKPFYTWKNYHEKRGMSPWRDVIDWVGGYPFEVAKPDEVFEFFQARGFVLRKLKTTARWGNNQFVLELP
ncbi:MAG: class I SAM-dependent methyltransferase [Caldilineaceae bacterium]